MSSTVTLEEEKDLWGGGVAPMKASYGKLMMWFFLLSDAFTFSGLLAAYGFVRFKHTPNEVLNGEYLASIDKWPLPDQVFNAVPILHGVNLPLVFVGVMTFILILSSVTMVLAVEAGQRMDKKAVEKWMLLTVIGGAIFLACQAWEWAHFIHGTGNGGANLVWNEYGPPAFADFFFFITGFHGTHVLSGVILNLIIFYNVATGMYQRRGHYEMVEKVGLYWHFVDLVWVFVFTFFYLV